MSQSKIKIPTSWDQSDPITSIAISNYQSAIENAKAYESLEMAVLAYSTNADDSAIGQGFPKEKWGQAGDAVFALWRHNLSC